MNEKSEVHGTLISPLVPAPGTPCGPLAPASENKQGYGSVNTGFKRIGDAGIAITAGVEGTVYYDVTEDLVSLDEMTEWSDHAS